jgi:RNA polymerase sigma-70 factor (ECF subfamily)
MGNVIAFQKGVSSLRASERAIIERCKRGDITAFDELLTLHEKHAYNLAYRLTNNYDDANDIVQEAFIRVYNSIHSFRGDANFSTWLYRVITNVYLDQRKKEKNRPHTSLEEYIELDDSTVSRQVQDTNPLPDEMLEDKERKDMIESAIRQLPDYQRAMVVLYHVQGCSYEEIGQIMGMPLGTVKSRLNRARLALKDKLQPVRELFGF